jgi:hypothetical protein
MQEDQLQEGRGNGLFTIKNFIILLVGFILGYLIKTQAVQTITMGYDDYKISQWQSNTKNTNIEKEDSVQEKEKIQEGENIDLNIETDKTNK